MRNLPRQVSFVHVKRLLRRVPTPRLVPAPGSAAAPPPVDPPGDSRVEALAHKQRVRAAATRRAAQIALLFLTCDEGPLDPDHEARLVVAAWSEATCSLGHQQFVRTQPTTFSDLRALAG